MARQDLIDYIKSLLNQGYTPPAIRAQMLRYGYLQKDIDAALSAIQSPHTSHTTLIISTTLVILILVATLTYIFFSTPKTQTSILLTLAPTTTTLTQNDNLIFEQRTALKGTKTGIGTLTYDITDSTGTAIHTENNKLTLTTRDTKLIRIPLNKQKYPPGTYTIKATLKYNTLAETDTFSFTINATLLSNNTPPPTTSTTLTPEKQPQLIFEQTLNMILNNNSLTDDQKNILLRTSLRTYGNLTFTPATKSKVITQLMTDINETIPEKALREALERTTPNTLLPPTSTFFNHTQSPQQTNTTSTGDTSQCPKIYTCTEAYIENNQCKYRDKIPCCGNNQCEIDSGETALSCAQDCTEQPASITTLELIKQATTEATTDPTHARKICASIPTPSSHDNCFQSIVDQTANSNFCSEIIDATKKDSCYFFFVYSTGDISACKNIKDETYIRTCRTILQIQAYALQYDTQCDTANATLREFCDFGGFYNN